MLGERLTKWPDAGAVRAEERTLCFAESMSDRGKERTGCVVMKKERRHISMRERQRQLERGLQLGSRKRPGGVRLGLH